ncbi:MAG: molybdopterin-dependent oxidoreductase [Acidimicrobiales bacterium]
MSTTETWHQSACILCSINCGIEVRLGGEDGRTFERIRGDKAHPTSAGYTCEKALRLDHYQNGRHRLTTPLRRGADGTHEPIDWETAIAEIATRLGEVRDTYGGASILTYGGGGQGNHLGGGYGRSTRAAFGSVYTSNALAQEKTGEFWVDGQLFGRPRCHTTGDWEHAEVLVFVGKNPWQSHGFPRARTVLKAAVADPNRSIIVIDPRRTETADLADIHLQVRPGGDAWCLGALLAALVDEALLAERWLAEHATGLEDLLTELRRIPIDAWSARAGLTEAEVRAAARRIATARGGVSMFEDLGIQQAPHSTLSSYLEKLVYLLTGNFAIPGGMQIHSRFASLSGGGGPGGSTRTTPVTGQRIITGLIPCTAIPDEILTDHPDRFRALIVESSNPAHSLPDSQRMRAALESLDTVVVIDIALTETGRLADYVLPASSQFEKWEATFFNLEFPRNAFHLRRPLLAPMPGTLPEPEIHRRLVRASGVLDADGDAIAELRAAADRGRAAYLDAFLRISAERPHLGPHAPVLLYETLGPTLGAGNEATAAVWGLAQTCFLSFPESVRRAGFADGDALFDAILGSPSGVVFTVDDYEDTWRRLDTPDGLVHLVVADLMDELRSLHDEPGPVPDPTFPIVLSAGERRSSTANTIYRDPSWRKKDPLGALRLSTADAASIGVADGDRARVVTRRGSAVAVVEVSDTLRTGHASLPNGFGLGDEGGRDFVGIAPNELTSTEDRDWLAGTPHHKHVPARIERVEAESIA